MTTNTPDICPMTGLPVETVRQMLDEAAASIAAGNGIEVTTEAQHKAFYDDIIRRGTERHRARQLDRTR